MRRTVGLWVALAGLALTGALLAGCQPTGQARGAASITVVMTEMRFTPNRIDAVVGKTITLYIENHGAQRHDLAFPALQMPSLKSVETALDPGQSTTVSLRFDQPGIHTFICTLPGHLAAGMSGVVYVTE